MNQGNDIVLILTLKGDVKQRTFGHVAQPVKSKSGTRRETTSDLLEPSHPKEISTQ